MCGRFSFSYDWYETLQYFGIYEVALAPPRYNIAPGQMIHAVVSDGTIRKIEESRSFPGLYLDLQACGMCGHGLTDPS